MKIIGCIQVASYNSSFSQTYFCSKFPGETSILTYLQFISDDPEFVDDLNFINEFVEKIYLWDFYVALAILGERFGLCFPIFCYSRAGLDFKFFAAHFHPHWAEIKSAEKIFAKKSSENLVFFIFHSFKDIVKVEWRSFLSFCWIVFCFEKLVKVFEKLIEIEFKVGFLMMIFCFSVCKSRSIVRSAFLIACESFVSLLFLLVLALFRHLPLRFREISPPRLQLCFYQDETSLLAFETPFWSLLLSLFFQLLRKNNNYSKLKPYKPSVS